MTEQLCHVDHVGQFWHPHRVSMKKVERHLRRCRALIVGKPRVRLFDNRDIGLFLFVWGQKWPS